MSSGTPFPENINELVKTHGIEAIANMMGVTNSKTFRHRFKRDYPDAWEVLMSRRARPIVKSDIKFPRNIMELARIHTVSEIAAMIGAAPGGGFRRRFMKDYPEAFALARQNGVARQRTHKPTRKLIPKDLAETSKTMTLDEQVVHYGIGRKTLIRMRKKIGVSEKRKGRPLPDNIVELARTMSIADLSKHCGFVNDSNFSIRLKKENPQAYALASSYGKSVRAKRSIDARGLIPDGFSTDARKMTFTQASEKYKTSIGKVKQWAEWCGDGLYEAMLENGQRNQRLSGVLNKTPRSLKMRPAEKQREDEVIMTYIRRRPGWVCYSDRVYGGKGEKYYVGSMVVDYDGLLSVAKRYGFQP